MSGATHASNREFLRSLGIAIISLVVSSAFLAAVYLGFSPRLSELKSPAGRHDARPWILHGEDLIARMGQGQNTPGKGLRITGLEPDAEPRGIFTRRVKLQAADYPFLQYTITDRHPAGYLYFIWRTEESPQEVYNAPLHWAGDDPSTTLLARNGDWKGTITEVGVDIYGNLRGRATTIESLNLSPASGNLLLQTLWTDWSAQRLWNQESINYWWGYRPGESLSPTLAAAIWTGASLLLATALCLLLSLPPALPCALVLLISWAGLDLLWQKNLSGQLEETRYLFQGKSQNEKHLDEEDSDLYRYAQSLKNEVLPAPGVRIFLLHEAERRGYRRLRTQFHLLPHNIYNFGSLPRASSLQAGDYLLVLDEIEQLSYLQDQGVLTWNGESLPVELIDARAPGALYRYRGPRQL